MPLEVARRFHAQVDSGSTSNAQQVLSASVAVDKECVPIEHHQLKIKNHITCSKPPVNANKFCWKHCRINNFIKILGWKSNQTQGESPHVFLPCEGWSWDSPPQHTLLRFTVPWHNKWPEMIQQEQWVVCGCMWVGQQVPIHTTSALKILGCESRAACGIKLRCFTEPEIVGNFESA